MLVKLERDFILEMYLIIIFYWKRKTFM